MSAAGRAEILGVDGGGTSTVAWLADGAGRVLGRGRAGPSNVKAVGADTARTALAHAIAGAFEDAGIAAAPVTIACLGMAGFGRPADRCELTAWADAERWAERLLLVNDGDLVIAAGTPGGSGLAVIAGTGSIAVGCTPDGRTARAGGWGPLFGDEGSAYAVAVEALRLVARRADGREGHVEDDVLTARTCAALGVGSASEIVSAVYAAGFDRMRVAALAPLVVAAAAADRTLATRLLEPAGAALAEMALAVAAALDWPRPDLPLALAGSFLLAAADVRRALRDRIEREGWRLAMEEVAEPVQGALLLARRELAAASAPSFAKSTGNE
jgi:N-acetylglucosamine kinase-like BadF-type ATPase